MPLAYSFALPAHAAVKQRLATHLPEREVPIVMEGLEGWSIPVSADKPLEGEPKNKARNKAKQKK
ncbi:MAG: hypothetical protein F6K35_29775 [Okeania sp. SIO2H7]|nr:hypothetical protein [Okeania sp. SIO2H7]